MGDNLIFNTLQYSNRLKKAGVCEEQANVHAEAIADLVDNRMATKKDLEQIKNNLLIKLGGMMVTGIALIVFLLRLFER